MGAALSSPRALSRWIPAWARVPGRSHEQDGVQCQDHVNGGTLGGVTAIALSDGCGSVRRADVGAQLTTVAAIDALTRWFDRFSSAPPRRAGRALLRFVRQQVTRRALAEGRAVGDFAATLLAVAVRGNHFVAAHIGDGLIVARRGQTDWVISRGQRGEHANETTFVTSARASEGMFFATGTMPGLTAIALMSDGSAESMFARSESKLAPALASAWSWLDHYPPSTVSRSLERSVLAFARERTMDDCSLALLRRVTVPASRLQEFPPEFQRTLLGCASARGTESRLAVLRAQLDLGDLASNQAVAAALRCSPSTVRRHDTVLRSLTLSDLAGPGVPPA